MTQAIQFTYDEEFIMEASELLDGAEDALLKLDDHGHPNTIYNCLFRAIHSLKGTSGMLGFKELHDHLHGFEDYLQKSKGNLEHFKNSVDFYLRGIDISRQLLKGERPHESTIITKNYLIEAAKYSECPKKDLAEQKNILYLSKSLIKPLGRDILDWAKTFQYNLTFKSPEELGPPALLGEEYDILISDIDFMELKSFIPIQKMKLPTIIIVDFAQEDLCSQTLFQVLKKDDEKIRIHFTLLSANNIKIQLDLFEKAKNLLMFMYSDLEEYLIDRNQVDNHRYLQQEIKNFLKKYSK